MSKAFSTIKTKEEELTTAHVAKDKLFLQVTKFECDNRILDNKLSAKIDVLHELKIIIRDKDSDIDQLKNDNDHLIGQVNAMTEINKNQVCMMF